MTDNQQLSWDDPIDPTVTENTLLKEGPGTFEILKLERTRREYGKFGTCNLAVLTVMVTDAEGQTDTWEENLPMVKAMIWKLSAFFAAIGQRNHNDPEAFKPNWKAVVGSTGKCEIETHEWETRKKEKRKDNRIKAYIAPEPVDPDFT